MISVPFFRPDLGDDEIAAVVDVLNSGWLTTGPVARAFEDEFATYLGVKHAVALNSATAGLHLALEAAGVGPGDEVLVPTYTFTATAEVVTYLGARPVLVDCLAADLNIDASSVEALITPKTRAIIGVDIAGVPCNWPALRSIADVHGLVLIDDAAHALPASLNGRVIGTWADTSVFSFYATKTMTTGEGGMLVTNKEEWARRARQMSLHGLSHDAWRRYGLGSHWRYEVLAPGFKYNMTDVAAAIGRVQLRRLDEMAARRRRVAALYEDALGRLAALELPRLKTGVSSAWHLYIVRLNPEQAQVERDEFIRRLGELGVMASVHFIPLHLHPYYRNSLGVHERDFPVASREFSRVVSLPLFSAMRDEEIEAVIRAVNAAVQR